MAVLSADTLSVPLLSADSGESSSLDLCRVGGDTATGKLATEDGRGWWALVGIRDWWQQVEYQMVLMITITINTFRNLLGFWLPSPVPAPTTLRCKGCWPEE